LEVKVDRGRGTVVQPLPPEGGQWRLLLLPRISYTGTFTLSPALSISLCISLLCLLLGYILSEKEQYNLTAG